MKLILVTILIFAAVVFPIVFLQILLWIINGVPKDVKIKLSTIRFKVDNKSAYLPNGRPRYWFEKGTKVILFVDAMGGYDNSYISPELDQRFVKATVLSSRDKYYVKVSIDGYTDKTAIISSGSPYLMQIWEFELLKKKFIFRQLWLLTSTINPWFNPKKLNNGLAVTQI